MNTLKAGLVAVGLVIGTAAMAQDGGHHKTAEERAQFRTDALAKELSLTEEQKAKVTELNVQSLQKKEAILKDASLSEEQRKEAFRANHKATKEQLKTILTAEQQTKLAAKRDEMKAKHADRAAHRTHEARTPEQRAQFRTDRMAKQLSLTEEQQTKVAVSNLKAVKEEDAIRNDSNLTDDQRKASFKGSRNAYKAELKEILTEEQLALLKKQKEEHIKSRGDRKCAKPQQPVAPQN